MEFENIDKAFAYIQNSITDVLKNEVATTVKKTHQEVVDDLVYDDYIPSIYIRRGANGGLGDIDNYNTELINDDTLVFTNNTPFNDGYGTKNRGNNLVNLIEGGHGSGGYLYDYPNNKFSKPRPIMEMTAGVLENSDELENTIKRGLKKRGLNNE